MKHLIEKGYLGELYLGVISLRLHRSPVYYSAAFTAGLPASLSQIVPINAGQSLELLVSLASIAVNPRISIQVLYLNDANAEVGRGLDINIPRNSLTNIRTDGWREIYQVTEPAPANATQAQVVISQQFSLISLLFGSSVFVDDVALLAYAGGGEAGPTGPTGATGV